MDDRTILLIFGSRFELEVFSYPPKKNSRGEFFCEHNRSLLITNYIQQLKRLLELITTSKKIIKCWGNIVSQLETHLLKINTPYSSIVLNNGTNHPSNNFSDYGMAKKIIIVLTNSSRMFKLFWQIFEASGKCKLGWFYLTIGEIREVR